MGEKLISLQDQKSYLKGCYDMATQANMLRMPEQYLFSPEAKKIFPSLLTKLNWQNDLSKWSKRSSSKLLVSLIYKITSQLAEYMRAAP